MVDIKKQSEEKNIQPEDIINKEPGQIDQVPGIEQPDKTEIKAEQPSADLESTPKVETDIPGTKHPKLYKTKKAVLPPVKDELTLNIEKHKKLHKF